MVKVSELFTNAAAMKAFKSKYGLEAFQLSEALPLPLEDDGGDLDGEYLRIPVVAITEAKIPLPLPRLVRAFLAEVKLHPCQLSPNSYRILGGILALNRILETPIGVTEILYCYEMRAMKGHKYNLQSRYKYCLVHCLPSSNKYDNTDILVGGNWKLPVGGEPVPIFCVRRLSDKPALPEWRSFEDTVNKEALNSVLKGGNRVPAGPYWRSVQILLGCNPGTKCFTALPSDVSATEARLWFSSRPFRALLNRPTYADRVNNIEISPQELSQQEENDDPVDAEDHESEFGIIPSSNVSVNLSAPVLSSCSSFNGDIPKLVRKPQATFGTPAVTPLSGGAAVPFGGFSAFASNTSTRATLSSSDLKRSRDIDLIPLSEESSLKKTCESFPKTGSTEMDPQALVKEAAQQMYSAAERFVRYWDTITQNKKELDCRVKAEQEKTAAALKEGREARSEASEANQKVAELSKVNAYLSSRVASLEKELRDSQLGWELKKQQTWDASRKKAIEDCNAAYSKELEDDVNKHFGHGWGCALLACGQDQSSHLWDQDQVPWPNSSPRPVIRNLLRGTFSLGGVDG